MLSIEVLDLHGDVHKLRRSTTSSGPTPRRTASRRSAPGTEAHDNDDQLVVLYVNPLATAAVRVEKDDLPG